MELTYNRLRAQVATVTRVEHLLRKYPDLFEDERSELVRLIPRLGMVEQATIAADERLSKKLGDLYRDHDSFLDGSRRIIGLLAVPATVLVLLMFNWMV